jgi:hypothetical protein
MPTLPTTARKLRTLHGKYRKNMRIIYDLAAYFETLFDSAVAKLINPMHRQAPHHAGRRRRRRVWLSERFLPGSEAVHAKRTGSFADVWPGTDPASRQVDVRVTSGTECRLNAVFAEDLGYPLHHSSYRYPQVMVIGCGNCSHGQRATVRNR